MRIKTDTNSGHSPTYVSEDSNRILVLGLGNILLEDEGIGAHIVKELQKQALPDNVEVIDGGTAGVDVLLLQRYPYRLVVIDAVDAGGKPGTIYKATLKAQEKNKLNEIFGRGEPSKISLHQSGLIDALSAVEKLQCGPEEIVIIGVQPKRMGYGLELSEPLHKKVPELIRKVLEETKNDIHRE
jgi:hydrogenase maturation protease